MRVHVGSGLVGLEHPGSEYCSSMAMVHTTTVQQYNVNTQSVD